MSAKILKPNKKVFQEAISILKKGDVIAFPTETVYGLGADALNPNAVKKIFEIKNRPLFNPLIVHIAEKKDIEKLCTEINEKTKILINHFWPGPLTIIFKKSKIIPNIVTAESKNVAIRMPSHPVALKLIKKLKKPICAPSANLFKNLSPTTADHTNSQIGEKINLIIDGGKCDIGIESTILDLTTKTPCILRPGGITQEEIEKIIGKVHIKTTSKNPKSSGQLAHHYSPQTPFKILKKRKIIYSKSIKMGLLTFKKIPKEKDNFQKIEILSKKGNLKEAAHNLFDCLYKLDKSNLDIIYAEPLPNTGLGKAIMNRLKKAENINKIKKK